MAHNQVLGHSGESLAANYLQKQGYRIIGRNFLMRGGEIDVIARDGDAIVFIEVKTRYGLDYGRPQEAITKKKLHFLRRAVAYYCSRYGFHGYPLRIDAICISRDTDTPGWQIEHIKNISI